MAGLTALVSGGRVVQRARRSCDPARRISFEGDSQPLGYSLWNEARGDYDERPDKPNSGPNPGEDPAPMDADTRAFIEKVIVALGGKVAP
jgi:hypothetical protein